MNQAILSLLMSRRFWIITCLLGALACLASGLGELVRDAGTNLLLPVILAGGLLSYGLGVSRLKSWQAWGLGTILGAAGIFFRVANLSVPAAGLLGAVPNFCAQVMLWLNTGYQPDFSVQQFFIDDIFLRSNGLALRIYGWSYGILNNITIIDPAARAFVWALGVWLIALWAGWAVARQKNAVTALAPALVTLALVNDYSQGNPLTVLWLLAFTLLLLGIGQFDKRILRWKSLNIDFSESTGTETTVSIIVAAMVLVSFAWVVPSISVRALWDEWRTRASQRDTVAESLGISQPAPQGSKVQNYRGQGLPRSHLLGSGQELEKVLVFTVSTGELPPVANAQTITSVPAYYWRSLTYDTYLGSGWATSQTEDEDFRAGTPVLEAAPAGYRMVRQTFTHAQDNLSRLYFTGTLLSADQPLTIAWRTKPGTLNDPAGGADLFGAITPAQSYTVVSYLPQVSADDLRNAPVELPAAILSRYTQLPRVPERVLALARDLTATQPTHYDQALAIQDYLRANYLYTLDVPAPPTGRDVADYFLFDLKEGYCDYYATSMVVLARAAGIPARMVSGYAPGEYDAPSAKYIVKESNAHSWVEIYFPTIGWVEFEPTSAYAEISRSGTSAIPTPPSLPADESALSRLTGFFESNETFFAWAGAIAAGSVFLLAAGLWLEQFWWMRLAPVETADAIFRGMEKWGNAMAGPGAGKETPYEFSSRLKEHMSALSKRKHLQAFILPAGKEIDAIIDLYIQAIFSPRPPDYRHARATVRTWQGLRARLALGYIAGHWRSRDSRKK